MVYTVKFTGYYKDGGDFSEVVEVGPAPDLSTAIMWERTALEQSGYVIQSTEDLTEYDNRAEYSDALRKLKWD